MEEDSYTAPSSTNSPPTKEEKLDKIEIKRPSGQSLDYSNFQVMISGNRAHRAQRLHMMKKQTIEQPELNSDIDFLLEQPAPAKPARSVLPRIKRSGCFSSERADRVTPATKEWPDEVETSEVRPERKEIDVRIRTNTNRKLINICRSVLHEKGKSQLISPRESHPHIKLDIDSVDNSPSSSHHFAHTYKFDQKISYSHQKPQPIDLSYARNRLRKPTYRCPLVAVFPESQTTSQPQEGGRIHKALG